MEGNTGKIHIGSERQNCISTYIPMQGHHQLKYRVKVLLLV